MLRPLAPLTASKRIGSEKAFTFAFRPATARCRVSSGSHLLTRRKRLFKLISQSTGRAGEGTGVPANISTSLVDRSHLTLRQSCKRFARLGLGFSKSPSGKFGFMTRRLQQVA